MCKVIGYDSLSEPPGFLLGTSWTVRSAMLMYKEEKKKKMDGFLLPTSSYFEGTSLIQLI
jgi:hypothetical protein